MLASTASGSTVDQDGDRDLGRRGLLHQGHPTGDGYAEFTVTANNVYWMAGLSNGDTNTSYQDIDYAVYV